MIPRLHMKFVRRQLARNPAVAIVGPRQCGKTTLALRLGGRYFDLEDEGDAVRLDAEWDTLVRGRELVVLDEVQQAPWVFPRLRGAIDRDRRRMGRFLLLGSVSPALMTQVAESLAGRLALVRLSPFLLPELKANRLDDLWLRGGYPDGGIIDSDRFPSWQRDYLDLLAMRDLPAWGLPAKPPVTQRLMRMLAASHGQPFNASQLGSGLSVDAKTVQRYCDYLEGAFLLRRLPPYLPNIRKRLVRRPRLYWRDSGLLHALLGITTLESLYGHPDVGASWEGFVIEQTLATLEATGQVRDAYFFRTSDGKELDLVLVQGEEIVAVEIKLTSSPTREMVAALRAKSALIGARRSVLVCRVARRTISDDLLVTSLSGWLHELL